MAFGNAITDGVEVAVGANGEIVRFSLHAQEAESILQIQMQKTSPSLITGVPVQAPVPPAALAGYLDAPGSVPDCAFSFSGEILDVFLKGAVYPFSSTIRLGIWYYRNAKNVSATTDYIDVLQEARKLFVNFCLDEGYTLKGKRPKFDLDTIINAEQTSLGL